MSVATTSTTTEEYWSQLKSTYEKYLKMGRSSLDLANQLGILLEERKKQKAKDISWPQELANSNVGISVPYANRLIRFSKDITEYPKILEMAVSLSDAERLIRKAKGAHPTVKERRINKYTAFGSRLIGDLNVLIAITKSLHISADDNRKIITILKNISHEARKTIKGLDAEEIDIAEPKNSSEEQEPELLPDFKSKPSTESSDIDSAESTQKDGPTISAFRTVPSESSAPQSHEPLQCEMDFLAAVEQPP